MARLKDITRSRDISSGTVSWSPGTLPTALTADKGSQRGTHSDRAEEATQTHPVSCSSTGCQTEAALPGLETKVDVFKIGVCCEKCGRFFVQKDRADAHWWQNHFVVSKGELLQLFGGTKSPYSSNGRKLVQVDERTHAKEGTCRTSPQHCSGKSSRQKRKHPKNPDAHICGVCERHFSSKRCLITHMRLHTGERPYVCGICQKQFYWKKRLTSHMNTHEKPHTCQLCPQRFANKRGLAAHMKWHGARAREILPSCGVCQELFSDRGSLIDHEKSAHTDAIEENYACITCHEVFSEKAGLLSHQCKLIMRRMFAVTNMFHLAP